MFQIVFRYDDVSLNLSWFLKPKLSYVSHLLDLYYKNFLKNVRLDKYFDSNLIAILQGVKFYKNLKKEWWTYRTPKSIFSLFLHNTSAFDAHHTLIRQYVFKFSEFFKLELSNASHLFELCYLNSHKNVRHIGNYFGLNLTPIWHYINFFHYF